MYAVTNFLPRQLLCDVYTTYIQTHFDYCDVIYDRNVSIADTIQFHTLYNRIARPVMGIMRRTSTDRLLDELGWVRLQTRRKIQTPTFTGFSTITPLPSYRSSMLPESQTIGSIE